MKVATILSFLGLLALRSFAAPSQHQKKDVNIFLYEPAPVATSKSLDSPFSTLETGTYIITSPGLEDNQVIGRFMAEDLSLRPKRILTESRSVPHQLIKWSAQKLPNGKYRLSVLGAPVQQINRQLYAVLLDYPPAGEWIIIPQRDGTFSIEDGNDNAWMAGTDDFSQVEVKPIDGSLQSLFRFTRVDEGVLPQHEKGNANTFLDASVPKMIGQAPPGDLYTGAYIITSLALPNGLGIGRSIREDRSLLPKQVVTTFKDNSQWIVRALPNGNYRLSIRQTPVVNINGKIFAVLLDFPEPGEWVLNRRGPDNTFTIEDNNGNAWVADPELDSQVRIAPLDTSFPAKQLFKITPRADYIDVMESTKESTIDFTLIVEEL